MILLYLAAPFLHRRCFYMSIVKLYVCCPKHTVISKIASHACRICLCNRICKKGVLYIHIQFCNLEEVYFLSKLLGRNHLSYNFSDRKVLLPTFKAVSQTQIELHILEVEKLDACIRPFSHIQSHM